MKYSKNITHFIKMTKRSNDLFLRDTVISLILITQNDSDIIHDILLNINKVLSKKYPNYEILVIDNYSEDDTVERIREVHQKIPHLRIIRLSKLYGNELALTAGLDNCIGDYAVVFNIYTDPPDMIPILVNKLISIYDIVIARYNDNFIHKDPLSTFFLFLVRKLSSHEFYYDSNYLIGLNRKTINSITRIRRKSRNFSYLNTLIGYKKTIIEYKPLKNNLSKLKTENLFELIWRVTDIIISNSYRPMRMLIALGMIISLSFLIYVFIIAILTITLHQSFAPKGWISISSVLGTMFLLLFSLLTLISEYIIRVLDESRNEPLYFIADEMDKSIISLNKDRLNVI